MKKEEIIDYLEFYSTKEEAILSFCYDEDNQDNEHIKANKDGLVTFAIFILRIAFDINPKRSEHQDGTYPLDNSLGIPGEGLNVHYIKLIHEKRSSFSSKEKEKYSWKDRLFIIGCLSLLIGVVLFAVIGLISIVLWLI